MMVDHGYIFNGPQWEYVDAPAAGLYFRRFVYQAVRGWNDFEPWLERITNFPEHVLDDALRRLPTEWLDGDAAALYGVLEKLMARRRCVPDLIMRLFTSGLSPFPKWRGV
jgi:hypothetical protein